MSRELRSRLRLLLAWVAFCSVTVAVWLAVGKVLGAPDAATAAAAAAAAAADAADATDAAPSPRARAKDDQPTPSAVTAAAAVAGRGARASAQQEANAARLTQRVRRASGAHEVCGIPP